MPSGNERKTRKTRQEIMEIPLAKKSMKKSRKVQRKIQRTINILMQRRGSKSAEKHQGEQEEKRSMLKKQQ